MNKKEASSPLSLRRTPITPSRFFSRGRVERRLRNKGRRLDLAAASTPSFSNHTTGRVETVTTNTANVEEEEEGEVVVIDNEKEKGEIEVMGVKRPSMLIQERLNRAEKSGQVVSLVDTPDKIKTTIKTTVVVDKENAEVEVKQKRSSSSTAVVSSPATGRGGTATTNTTTEVVPDVVVDEVVTASSSTALVSSPGREGTATSFLSPRSKPRCQRFATATALKHRQGRSPTRRDIAVGIVPSARDYKLLYEKEEKEHDKTKRELGLEEKKVRIIYKKLSYEKEKKKHDKTKRERDELEEKKVRNFYKLSYEKEKKEHDKTKRERDVIYVAAVIIVLLAWFFANI